MSAALAAVMGDLGGIGKMTPEQRRRQGLSGGDERGISYAYRGIDQIASAVQPLFAKYGVVTVPQIASHDVKDITVNGKPWTDTTVVVRWTILGPGGDSVEASTLGLGRDNSDKGANKAITQAYKNLLLRLLCIGDPDDDVDGHTHEADAAAAVDVGVVLRQLGWDSRADQETTYNKLRERTIAEEADSVKAWAKAQNITKNTLTHDQAVAWRVELEQFSATGADTREGSGGNEGPRVPPVAEQDLAPAPPAVEPDAESEASQPPATPPSAPSRTKLGSRAASDAAKKALAHAGLAEAVPIDENGDPL